MTNVSTFDPTRKTVGSIHQELAKNNKESFVENGDLTNSIMQSLVDDLNEWVKLDPYHGKPFYILVKEKKDLQLKRAIFRIPYVFAYRPYPEHDTKTFWVNPKTNMVKFCWDIPHRSEMDNILVNWNLFDKNLVNCCRAWLDEKLEYFGLKWGYEDGVKVLKENDTNNDILISGFEHFSVNTK